MRPARQLRRDTELAAADPTFLRTVLAVLLGLTLGNAMIMLALL
jgi:hypothetical protein